MSSSLVFRHAALPALALALGLAAAGCADRAAPSANPESTADRGPAVAFEVVDDAGRAVELPMPAQRIVSLVPSVTETLLALGAGSRLVARTDYDEHPALFHLPSLGGGLTPSLELIASLQPDLVVAWEEAGSSRIRTQLEALGIPVYADQTRDTAGVYRTIQRMGRLLALDGAADSLARAMRADLAAVAASVGGLERPSVLYLISLDPPMAAGPSLFIGEILGVAGGANAFDDLATPSPQISMEEIVRRRPRVVLIPTGADSVLLLNRLRSSPGWRELLASGETRIQTLPADVLHRPGPAIVGGARALRNAIHSGAPREPR